MKSYKEYLTEQTLGKELAPYIPIPMGGFYIDAKVNKLIGFNEAKEEGPKTVLPTPVLMDRYDIVYMSQFPARYYSSALYERYSNLLFDSKEDERLQERADLVFDKSHGTGSSMKLKAKNIHSLTSPLIKKLETPFQQEYIHDLLNTPEDKQELANRIHGDQRQQNPNPFEDDEYFSPEYAVYGYDLTRSGEYSDKKTKSKTLLGSNYIAPQQKHIGDTIIPQWAEGVATGMLRGNPNMNYNIFGEPEGNMYKFQDVMFGTGGKQATFSFDFRGMPRKSTPGENRGYSLPVYTAEGIMNNLYALYRSVGIDALPFTIKNDDGLVEYLLQGEDGNFYAVRSYIPVLLEGESINSVDYRSVFGTDEKGNTKIVALFNNKDIGPPDEDEPLKLRMARLYKEAMDKNWFKNTNQIVETDEWLSLVQELKDTTENARRYDWGDAIHIAFNPTKILIPPEERETPFEKYRKASSHEIDSIKSSDVTNRGALNLTKTQKQCIPSRDEEIRQVVRDFTYGTEGLNSVIANGIKNLQKKLKANDATAQLNALESNIDDIMSYVEEYVVNCTSGYPLVTIYAEIKLNRYSWEEAPWKFKQKNIGIAFGDTEEDFMKDLQSHVHSFLSTKSEYMISNILQLDLGHGTRRKPDETQTIRSMDISDMIASTADKIRTMEHRADQAVAARAGRKVGAARAKGERTPLRSSLENIIYFAHERNNMQELLNKAKDLSKRAKVSINKAIEMIRNGDENAQSYFADGMEAAVIEQNVATANEVIDQIMRGEDINIVAAEQAAVEKLSNTKGIKLTSSKTLPEKKQESEDDVNQMLKGISEEEKNMLLRGNLNNEMLAKMLYDEKEKLADAVNSGDKDAIQRDVKIDEMLNLMGYKSSDDLEFGRDVAAASRPTHVPELLQKYKKSPSTFLQSIPNAIQQLPNFGAILIAELGTVANPEYTKPFADYFVSNPNIWNSIMNSANSDPKAQPLLQFLLQKDPHFKRLVPQQQQPQQRQVQPPAQQEAVGGSTGAIYDGKKSRDFNWSGSVGSTGVTPKESPIKSWLRKKRK